MAINGIIGILGGLVNVETAKTYQLTPAIIYDYHLNYEAPPSAFTYTSADTSVVTVDADGLVLAVGAVDSTCTITVNYTDDKGTVYKDIIDAVVRPEGWYPPAPPVDTDNAQPENILLGKKATVNGVQIIGTAEVYVDSEILYMPEGLLTPVV